MTNLNRLLLVHNYSSATFTLFVDMMNTAIHSKLGNNIVSFYCAVPGQDGTRIIKV
jgi:hypothetical protein